MSTSYDDCQDIEREPGRAEREDEIRQRLPGPIGQRPQIQARTPLHELAKKCVCAKAQELLDNAEGADGDYWVVSNELMSELEDLLDDLKTIEQEGW